MESWSYSSCKKRKHNLKYLKGYYKVDMDLFFVDIKSKTVTTIKGEKNFQIKY